MRSRYRGMGATRRTTRTKKPRKVVSVREKVLKKGGRCAGCRGRYEAGDKVTVVKIKRRVFHTATCVPPGIENINTVIGAGQQQVAAGPAMPKTAGEAAMHALLALENALVLRAKTVGISPDMEKAYEKYTKLKGMALRPGSDNEGRQAMKLATVELVKLVFAN